MYSSRKLRVKSEDVKGRCQELAKVMWAIPKPLGEDCPGQLRGHMSVWVLSSEHKEGPRVWV